VKDKIPDRRALEKISSDLGRLLAGQEFKTKADLQKYLEGLVKGKSIPNAPPKSAVEFAQDIMYDAWEADSHEERLKLAKEALSISLDCADAYNLLAEEAQTLEEARDCYQKAVEAGRRALGEKIFKEKNPHFWGYLPTRPYMRARAGLMNCIWILGEPDEAIEHARAMLRLNKNDNQGIRYILIAYLTDCGRWDELEKFMSHGGYSDDGAAEWCYTKALLAFVRHGASGKANEVLKIALIVNAFAPVYLVGKKPVPDELPDSITMGGEDEGFCYAARSRNAWIKVPGAIEWLKAQTDIR